MTVSIFTNAASMSSTNSLNRANQLLGTAMERLGTGKRINSAKDDAAGLQIATRLKTQSNGMAVAQRNISDANAMLQTGEGAFNEVTNIMYRMRDLATQAANDTNTEKDRVAVTSELKQLKSQLDTILGDTTYGGEKLFSGGATASGGAATGEGKFGKEMVFQIGSSQSESMKVNMSTELKAVTEAVGKLDDTALTIKTSAEAQTLMGSLETTLDNVGGFRSTLGAYMKRLEHAANNLANMKDNTDVGMGNIQDADYAKEASIMSRNNMLANTSSMMLKQSYSITGMAMQLLS